MLIGHGRGPLEENENESFDAKFRYPVDTSGANDFVSASQVVRQQDNFFSSRIKLSTCSPHVYSTSDKGSLNNYDPDGT